MENTPRKQKNNSHPSDPASWKQVNGFQMKGIPSGLITQASIPKLQGTNDMITKSTNYMVNPKIP